MRKVEWLLVAVVSAIFLAVPICGALLWQLSQWTTYSPGDYPLEQSRSLMQAVVRSGGGRMPDHIFMGCADSLAVGCWNILQEAALRNDNFYQMENPIIFGDYGTHIPGGTGSDIVVVEIVFSDGASVILQYYNSFLEECKEVNR